MIKLGPAGPMNGREWNEIGRTNIVQIILTYSETAVHSIQFVYYEEEKFVFSERFGSAYRFGYEVVKLDYPSEYIRGVSGVCSDECLNSIKFTTNIRTYGPFGMTAAASSDDYNYNYNLSLGDGSGFAGFYGFQNGSKSISIGLNMELPITFEEHIDETCYDFLRRNSKP